MRDPTITAYIFGGSLGIGLATARALARREARIALFARRRVPLEAAERTVRDAGATQVEGREADVTDRRSVERAVASVLPRLGVPDLVVNAAGRARPDYFERISSAQLEESLRLNLVGSWNTIQVLLPSMRERGRGHIVNVASIAGLIGVFGYTDYCASKFAVLGFSEALRSELRRWNLRVSVLCPPDTDTPGLAAEEATKPSETRAVSAAARILDADSVARALLDGVARGRFLIVPGRQARLLVLANRLAPGFVRWASDRAVKRAQR